MLRRTITIALLFVAAPLRALCANEAAPPDSVDALLPRLVTPADADLVHRLVEHPSVRSEPQTAQRLVTALGCGGYAATEGLVALTCHRDFDVRAEAFRRIGSIGIRSSLAACRAREAIRDSDPVVRDAAYAALGRVGEHDDVSLLLEALASDDDSVREAGYRAIRALSGLKMPALARHWEYWWALTSKDLPARIEEALRVLECGGTAAEATDARGFLAANAWFAPEDVRLAVRVWLRSAEPRVRVEGYRLAAAARLGDVATEVESTFKYEFEASIWADARAAARALGCRTHGIVPPPGVELPCDVDPVPVGVPGQPAGAAPLASSAAEAPRQPAEAAPLASPAAEAPRQPAEAAPLASSEVEAPCRMAVACVSRPSAPCASARAVVAAPRPSADAKLARALELMRSRRYPEARRAVHQAYAAAEGDAERSTARKGFVAMYWLQRLDDAEPVAAPGISAQARRVLGTTIWRDLF